MLYWSSHEEIPHACGKRNPSKMVGVARGHQRADALKPYSQKSSQSNHSRTTALSNSMKPTHACGATQDRRVMVERSDRMWSTGEGNGKPLQYSCLENPVNSMERQKHMTLKDKLPTLGFRGPGQTSGYLRTTDGQKHVHLNYSYLKGFCYATLILSLRPKY